MSSTAFEVVLHPDRTLRRIVAWSGIVMTVLGMILIAQMQIALHWRILIGIFWLLDGLREQRNLQSGARRLRSLILDSNGSVAGTDAGGNRAPLTLVTGSMVLPGLAWFRLRFGDGRPYAELFTRKHCGATIWHRLQLLWQQEHRAFGHPPGP